MPSQKILTIGIPTYNRSGFLIICLESIISQFNGLDKFIEINISDNASTDDTEEIVKDYIKNGLPINYYRNKENIGLDGNFAKLYELAKTKYIWMLSDDDFILPNTLKRIVRIIGESDFGIMYLNNYWYAQEIDLSFYDQEEVLRITKYENPNEFIERINYWITFTSSIIVNKDFVKEKINIYEFNNTMLLLLSWILPALYSNKPNLVIENKVIGCKSNNTGGYKLFTVFGKNFNFIMDTIIKRGANKEIKSIINKNLLTSFFPTFINSNNEKFIGENYFLELLPIFWKYKLFWINIGLPYLKKKLIIFNVRNISKKIISNILFKIVNSEHYDRLKPNENSKFYVKSNLKSIGENFNLPERFIIKNPQYISIGNDFQTMYNLRLEAWDHYGTKFFNPEIMIGNSVCFNTDCHIGCINKIFIGNNVLIASRVFITDHLHGGTEKLNLENTPINRDLESKGPVIIEDNVLIGEGVCIMPNVTIGANSIIGANSVVTKSFPANSIIVGIPAHLI